MDLQKRIFNGLIAGLVAGIVMDAIENAAYLLWRQPKVRAVDWVYVILTRRRPVTPREFYLGYLGHLVFNIGLGVAFSMIIYKSRPEKLVLKGWAWAAAVWVVAQVFTVLSKLPFLSDQGWKTRVQHLILASAYGMVLGTTVQRTEETLFWR